MREKPCSSCGKSFPVTRKYYYFETNGQPKGMCKECLKLYMREKYKKENEGKEINPVGRPRKEIPKTKPKKEEIKTEQECRVCGKVYPHTKEYFPINKSYKSGLTTMCRSCQSEYDREKYAKRRTEQGKKTKTTTKYQKLIKERDEREEDAFKKLITKPLDKGIGDRLDTLKFQAGKKYKVERRKNEKNEYEDYFIGNVVQDNNDHVTLKQKRGYRETFRKYDFLCGEYKIKEVRI